MIDYYDKRMIEYICINAVSYVVETGDDIWARI